MLCVNVLYKKNLLTYLLTYLPPSNFSRGSALCKRVKACEQQLASLKYKKKCLPGVGQKAFILFIVG
jgi:hypothetical protein